MIPQSDCSVMNKAIRAFLFLLITAAVAIATECPDRVLILPGLRQQASFKHFSGYLNGSNTARLHYWLTESQSNPQKDPLVLWLNGGPGCSSLNGLLTENGPFRIKSNGNLDFNQYSWNKVANIIYLESPVCVGYSYSTVNDCEGSDKKTVEFNFNALRHFLIKFNEFKGRDFYIAGESYGGYYIPTLAAKILASKSSLPLKFKGIIIGNPLSSTKINGNANIHFAYNHGLISDSLWEKILFHCCGTSDPIHCDITASKDSSCIAKVKLATSQFGNINPYNIYGKCVQYSDRDNSQVSSGSQYDKLMSTLNLKRYISEKHEKLWQMSVRVHSDVLPCMDTRPSELYLNRPLVRYALHINPNLATNFQWRSCNASVNMHYKRQYEDMQTFYQTLFEHPEIRIWIYNGDAGMVCCYLEASWFFEMFNDKTVFMRKPWQYKDADNSSQVGGFVQVHRKFTLITVKGAGHMVPTDTPIQALHLFQNFLENKFL